jgi:chromosome partitioning protein
MAITLFINLKGGVAKTTNAVAVAECFATQGRRVLVIDADHQCMASELLLGERRLLQCERRKATLHDLLAELLDRELDEDALDAYVTSKVSNIGGGIESMAVLPCSFRIDDFSTNMAKARRGYQSTEEFQKVLRSRRSALRRWLESRYDHTIIDCPPSTALQVRVFLTVADGFVLPSVPDRLSMRGSLYLIEQLRRKGYKTPALGLLWTLYRKQNSMHRRITEAVDRGAESFSQLPRPFATMIPNAAAIAEATELDREFSSFPDKYTSEFAKLYRSLCTEIESRLEQTALQSS